MASTTDSLIYLNDAFEIKQIVMMEFKKLGFLNVIPAANPSEALSICERTKGKKLIMIELSGDNACLDNLAIAREPGRVPTVLICDNADRVVVMAAVNFGVKSIIVRGADTEKFSRSLKKTLQKFGFEPSR